MFSKRNIERRTGAFLVAGFLVFLGHILNAEPTSGRSEVAAADAVRAVTEEESQDSPKKYYVVVFTKGPGYVEGGGGQPGMAEHVKFIKALHADGVVPLAGPLFKDDERTQVSGLLYFVRARSLEEARGVVMKEPLVHEKVAEISSIWEFIAGVGAGRLD